LYDSLNFNQITSLQSQFLYGIFTLILLLPVLIIIFLLETGRIPFDFAEAESELVADFFPFHRCFYFILFYLGEYFHLLCFSLTLALCLLGGWA